MERVLAVITSAILVVVIVEPSAVVVVSITGRRLIKLPLWSLKAAFEGKTFVLVRSRRFWVIVTSVRLVFPANAKSPKEVTDAGMETDVRRLLRNAEAPMEVTEEGIVRDVRRLFWNAPSPMAVTSEGMAAEVMFLLLKALGPIMVTVEGMDKTLLMGVPEESFWIIIMERCGTFSISLPLGFLKTAEGGKAFSAVFLSRFSERVIMIPLLPAKANSPREVTKAGIETEVMFLSRNAEAPMDVIAGGMNKSLLTVVPDGSF